MTTKLQQYLLDSTMYIDYKKMGNNSSQDTNSRMALNAMASMMKTSREMMIDLRETCIRLSVFVGDQLMIKRLDFHAAMTEVGVEEVPDFDVFDNLFTMFDKTGDNMVYTVIFLSSISCLVCREDVRAKLLFAMQMFDVEQTGFIGKGETLSLLVGINATASYLGDSVIMPKQIEVTVNDAFEKKEKIQYTILPELNHILGHPNVVQFINAAGTMRYGHSRVGAYNMP